MLIDRLIEPKLLPALHRAFDELFTGHFETGVFPDEVNWQEGESDPSLTRQICNGWKANRTIANAVLRADFGRAVAQLAGWPGARVMIDNVLWKPAGTRSLGYHQDNAYLQWMNPAELMSVWIALDDTSVEGGTVEMVQGSHRWKRSPPAEQFHAPENYQREMRAAAQREEVEAEITYVSVTAGGGSIHHGWTWHGSGKNHSPHPRRALVLHAMSSDTCFNPSGLAQGIGPIYSKYKKPGSNEMSEKDFPILWTRDGYRSKWISR